MLLKDKIILYFNKFIEILSFLVLPCIFAFTSSYLVFQRKNIDKIPWTTYASFFWLMYFSVYYALYFKVFYYAIIIYVFFVLLTAMFFLKYIQKYLKDPVTVFLFWFLYLSTVLSVFGSIYTMYYKNVIDKKDGPRGDRGDQGDEGTPGESLDKGIENNAYLTMLKACEEVLKEKKLEVSKINENRLGKNNFDPTKDYLKNIYFKDTLLRITNSDEFKTKLKKDIENKNYNSTLNNLVNEAKEWVKIIMSYKDGYKWLEDHFSTDYHWKTSNKYGHKDTTFTQEEKNFLNSIIMYYPNELVDKFRFNYGENLYEKMKKTIITYNINKFFDIRDKDLGIELDKIKNKEDGHILENIDDINNLNDLMRFYNDHKKDPNRLILSKMRVSQPELEEEETDSQDPFTEIEEKYHSWSWGKNTCNLSSEQLKLLRIQQDREDQQRKLKQFKYRMMDQSGDLNLTVKQLMEIEKTDVPEEEQML